MMIKARFSAEQVELVHQQMRKKSAH